MEDPANTPAVEPEAQAAAPAAANEAAPAEPTSEQPLPAAETQAAGDPPAAAPISAEPSAAAKKPAARRSAAKKSSATSVLMVLSTSRLTDPATGLQIARGRLASVTADHAAELALAGYARAASEAEAARAPLPVVDLT